MAEARPCPRCNGEIPVDTPEGLCPECLFQQALADPGEAADREQPTRSPAPPFVPPTPAQLAPLFPQLEVLELIGQGGMGAVYKARQPKLDRLVAIKVLPPEVARDPGFMERFSREARSLARLSHPNIITIFDFGESDGLYYFTMEYVDGNNVRELLETGQLTPPLALKVIPQVCDALQYAHDEGFVHRDIKPENILLDKKGRVRIADFGLARLIGLTPTYLTLTGSQQVMGTLYYMAPEQIKRTHAVDHRADLYSLGVVFYEMLTGELPMGRFAPPSHKAQIDARLDPIVLRALAREPELRYQDAGELKRQVESVAGLSSPVSPAAGPAAQERVHSVGDWPSVRFRIPQIFRTGGEARGEVYRDGENLIAEFQEFWGFWKSRTKKVWIPFHEITSICCQSELSPEIPIPESLIGLKGCGPFGGKLHRRPGPSIPRWMRQQTIQLVIKEARPGALAGLPVGRPGKGRLLIHREDQAAAQRLVDSIVQQPHRNGEQRDSCSDRQKFPGKVPESDEAWMETTTHAVGLIFTGVVAIIFALVLTVVGAFEIERRNYGLDNLDRKLEFGLTTFAYPLGALIAALFLIKAAVAMMRLRSYPLAVAAAVLAIVPWSPAWILGFPTGMLALAALRRPEVKAAFIHNRRPTASGLAPPKQPEPAPGKMASFFRSLAGYMLLSSAARSSAHPPEVAASEDQEPALPSSADDSPPPG